MLNFVPATAAESIGHGHGTRTTVGYVVRRTFPGDPLRLHEDVAIFTHADHGAGAYTSALERARSVRREADAYAVVDRLYDCGCRGLG